MKNRQSRSSDQIRIAYFMLIACLLFPYYRAWAAFPVFRTQASQVILVDTQTEEVLFEKNADQLMHPSSMTKIMTVYLTFQHLKKGEITLKDKLPVSKFAWRKGGSRMFVEVGTKVSVEDLLKGVIIQSGNDASIVISEYLSGNEGIFALEMTRTAKAIGATNTTFKNSTGWPDPSHLTTARDLYIIANRLIFDFPEYYQPYFSEKEFTYNNIRQMNRNPLLYQDIGCDGLKTGYTEIGGYGLVASAVQDDRRLIMVINGLKNKNERAKEAKSLMTWGFREFLTPRLFSAGQEVVRSDVWLGEKPDVPLVVEKDIYVTFPRRYQKDLTVKARYLTPIPPLQKGKKVGELEINYPGHAPILIPLIVAEDVEQAGFKERIVNAVNYLFWGKSRQKGSL